MILALDTDALVHWQMAGTEHHEATLRFIERAVRDDGARLGLTPQVLNEFLHVTTDHRRFQNPMTMRQAVGRVRDLWSAPECEPVLPGVESVHRTFALLEKYNLGRKRILDTALAAVLESARVSRLVTFNGRDFEVFPFLEVINPAGA